MTGRALIVMAKRPRAGHTKTRLCPPLTPETAASLYKAFLQDVLELVRSLPEVTPFVAISPNDQETAAYFQTLAPSVAQIGQVGRSLNERLENVMVHCSNLGYQQVTAINSDSPTLPTSFLKEGFARLDRAAVNVVFGPCEDGGYYLIGWKRPCPALIREVKMSTPHVLEETIRIAKREKLTWELLPDWYDVDSPADLERLGHDLARWPDRAKFTRQMMLNKWGSGFLPNFDR